MLGSQDLQRAGGDAESAHPAAKKALVEIWNAEDKDYALAAVKQLRAADAAKFGKAVVKVIDDLDELLAFYAFQAERWIHLRTANPIEGTFAGAAPHRGHQGTRLAGGRVGHGDQTDRVGQARWRVVNTPCLDAPVRVGAGFERGRLVERPEGVAA